MKQANKANILGLAILIILSSLILAACGNKKSDVDVSAASKITVTNEDIGFSLLKNVEADDDGNIFISPTSALIAMLMVYNGANGDTKIEIEEALQIDELSTEEINEATEALLTSLDRDDDELEVTLANSLWLNDQFAFQDEFSKNIKDYFDAEIAEIDVNDPASAKQINDWVKNATEGMIEEIVEAPLSSDLITYIINALYFNGSWQYEFDEKLTYDDIFHTENGEKEISFMSLEKEFTYFETNDLQAIKLPYGDGDMNMQVFLPREGYSIDELVANMDAKTWDAWQEDFETDREGIVNLPKFKLEYETLLNEALKELGIADAFDTEKADLSDLISSDEQLFISEVKQKTAIEVDEKGTEAAAATSVAIEMTSAPIEDENFYMDINRPFLLAIYDEDTEHALFLGVIKEPMENK